MLVFEREVSDNPTYYYRSTGESDKEFSADIVQVWGEVLKRIRENRADGSWNRLVFECWCGEGYIVVYPQLRGRSPDEKKPTVNVSLASLREIKQKLENAVDETETRSLAALAYTRVRGAIRNMYKREPALSELRNALKANDFTCWTMKNDDIETLMKFDVFF
jgi:hypothetical protein